MEWLPREQNELADSISKITDYDDWSITPQCFEYLNSIWGIHTCDLFASYVNHKINKFYARYWMPGCVGVDAFAFAWQKDV